MTKVRRSLPTMFEEFSYTGEWWLPEDPDRRFAGTLFYTPGSNFELKLVVNPSFLPQRNTTNLIFGDVLETPNRVVLVSTMKSYTIVDVEKDKSCIRRQGLHPDYLLTGKWLSQTENSCVKLKEVKVTYSSMRGWMKSGILNLVNEVSEATKPIKAPSESASKRLIYSNHSKHESRKIQEFQIPIIDSKLSLHAKFDFESIDSIDLHRTSGGYISIKPDSPQSIAWYRERIESTRNLLTFLTGLPIESKRVIGVLNEVEPFTDYVHIYHTVQPPKFDESHTTRLAFSLEYLGYSASDVFEAWFNLDEDEMIPFNLCLNVIHSEGKYPILDFLALTNALESYHRNIYMNNPSLAARLIKLTNSLPMNLRNELQLNNNYLTTIEATRNYYSHYDPKIRNNNVILEGEFLDDAIQRLIPLIYHHLARKLTISNEAILQVFERKKKHQGLWQQPWPKHPKKNDKQTEEVI